MEEIRKTSAIRTERLENEVVGCYVPAGREVVGCYSRPGVGKQEAPPKKPRRVISIFTPNKRS